MLVDNFDKFYSIDYQHLLENCYILLISYLRLLLGNWTVLVCACVSMFIYYTDTIWQIHTLTHIHTQRNVCLIITIIVTLWRTSFIRLNIFIIIYRIVWSCQNFTHKYKENENETQTVKNKKQNILQAPQKHLPLFYLDCNLYYVYYELLLFQLTHASLLSLVAMDFLWKFYISIHPENYTIFMKFRICFFHSGCSVLRFIFSFCLLQSIRYKEITWKVHDNNCFVLWAV